ncbi:hypothetical protein KPH14_011234 [Odynerus spinipes]|uniref:MD-2-related lipid-recognition domain-containing protein n=1 Tax=Odynerus spinipes TaxID=1348599 RepID=A0AAD9R9Z0_9HYME|nr:hypothetical protein KPH14_011234 [Odynerus spinipes]
MLRETLFVFAALVVVLSTATKVNHCDGTPFEDTNQVKISDCDTPPCLLKKKTRVSIEQKFTLEKDVNNMMTSVSAVLFGVPLPFVGVDGTNACDNIYDKDGRKVQCPLKKGETYIYRNDFPILEIYPKVPLEVHYALTDGNNQVICFTIPARITG